MRTRRSFMKKTAAAGIAGIVASGSSPVYARDMKKLKIGVLGLGSHGFAARFKNPPKDYPKEVKAIPYGVWDDYPGVAKFMKGDTYEKVYKDPVKLARECDCIHIEHADYRKPLELARPGLEMGKPTFINRPYVAKIGHAEEIVRLAKKYDAPLMCASSLEFGGEVYEMQKFMKEKGPIRAYEAYGPEAHFTWHLPHVINYAHAALGGGIESVYFTGHFGIDMRKWRIEKQKIGSTLCVLTYKPRNGEPPIIGMCHIGNYPGKFHIDVYTAKENKDFPLTGNWSQNMFYKINELYSFRTIPRPYEAILEQHRVLVAANVSRKTGRAVKLDSLGGEDTLPYSDAIRWYVMRRFLESKDKG
ncbi:MAG: twin-arginine translocation signal domain-containing protein [Candidatus Latescibacteria bacterium]|nr:twin-arginine translocation signal domain-containing protein [Candidatus Latescibacterota bacterium]